ncbi:hypothetical protein Pla163_01780 [Planctomycetes bacterium Pla163]|uniref:Uncharacterized protein n=1 Tax=Rohdeia mirabilis TaxID=2528008 RepID=A0A518CV35_9BACT|nr:hypothetical protein Pla163_01780 [Planctomycetes bacterium Pla163]
MKTLLHLDTQMARRQPWCGLRGSIHPSNTARSYVSCTANDQVGRIDEVPPD